MISHVFFRLKISDICFCNGMLPADWTNPAPVQQTALKQTPGIWFDVSKPEDERSDFEIDFFFVPDQVHYFRGGIDLNQFLSEFLFIQQAGNPAEGF